MEDPMVKSAKKQKSGRTRRSVSTAKPIAPDVGRRKTPTRTSKPAARADEAATNGVAGPTAKTKKLRAESKQSRVLAMLRSPGGATIAAMMQATGWQQHSVRGFLAGVVRKRLKLKLASKKVDGQRAYHVAGGGDVRANSRLNTRQAA
jgi:Protein of unknown function (DUF3489)